MKIFTFLKGAAIGAGLMYLFDPDMGRRRRAEIRDRAVRVWNDTGDAIEAKTHDLSNRAKGVLHDVTGLLPGSSRGGSGSQGFGPANSWMPSKWSPTTRLLVTAGIGLVAMYAKRRGGLMGAALGAVSMGVLANTVSRAELHNGMAGSAPALPSDYSERSSEDDFGLDPYPGEHTPRTARAH